jgi:hypothetical protein
MKNISIRVGPLPKVKEVCQLKDGRMEIIWEPVNIPIPEELSYLASRSPLPLARTQMRATAVPDNVEYVITKDGLWRGIRCIKDVWVLLMRTYDIPQKKIDAFIKAWTDSPVKTLIEKENWDNMVRSVAASRPWQKEAMA